jgi:hypothetical protein
MKAAWIVLVAFALLQSVSLTQCPCGSLCGHKNDCGPDPAGDDCCKNSGGADETPCFHLEPQMDLDGVALEAFSVPTIDAGPVHPMDIDRPEPGARRPVLSSDPSPPVRALLHSALLL